LSHNNGMHARFLIGPAGSGKTFRCLSEIREELARFPEGPDLILLAPKQATFQLERQLLAEGSVRGYTRLQILSFERLAAHVFDKLGRPLPELLSEEGRVMVLRAILEEQHARLRVFRASARLAGFARQLSGLLRELQRRRLGPDRLEQLAAKKGIPQQLAAKLLDLAMILRAYLAWAGDADPVRLEDGPQLFDKATEALARSDSGLEVDGLWLDGFAEMTPQEHVLLAAVLPHCKRATLAFCLPRLTEATESWLSPWAVVSETAHDCFQKVSALPGVELEVEQLARDASRSRFSQNPMLAKVERVMAGASPRPSSVPPGDQTSTRSAQAEPGSAEEGPSIGIMDPPALRLVRCSDVEAEAQLAAREVLTFVQEGGRFRDCAILVRNLDGYQDALRRVFKRYQVPCFLDQREPVSHHPLAELTRFALRASAFDWRPEDWLGALKTGLAGLSDQEVDQLENAALSRGWMGAGLWLQPLPPDADLPGRDRLEEYRARSTAPFADFHQRLQGTQGKPTGDRLAGWIRGLWRALDVEARLQRWGESPGGAVHATVWEQMQDWLDNLERAFRGVALPLRGWLQVIEAGLSGLSVGVIPPALDQVLVGRVDRSRNPDLKFVLVLGMNECVFPALPRGLPLLSEADVEDLETQGTHLSPGRRQFGHERYLGYIALTRARQRLLVSWSAVDARGRALNPSRFVDELKRAFPEIAEEAFDGAVPWSDCRHAGELAGTLLADPPPPGLEPLLAAPLVQTVRERWRQVSRALQSETLSPHVAAALHGDELNLSVSALEAFASCPFRFFVAHGLRARERDEFEVDARQTGSFQHEILADFHRRVMESGRRWRDLDPAEAVAWLREIGEKHLQSYQHGMMLADSGRAFHARSLLRNLERLVETMTVWARQNEFEPRAVEVSFGMEQEGWPAWTLDAGGGRRVKLRGRVDRVDLLPLAKGRTAVAILDYKSGGKQFEDLKFENGLQLQMPAYLQAICVNDGAMKSFGATSLRPAGVFYVGLRATPTSGKSRPEAQAAGETAAAEAFRHLGRFDASFVRKFDIRNAQKGDQFKYSFKNNGEPALRGNEALPEDQFAALLESASQQIRELGARIFGGEAAVSPYQHRGETACGICEFRPICRFDSWMQPYRTLRRAGGQEQATEAGE
jgi:ATP-dependent helicase/nuclease subunit B